MKKNIDLNEPRPKVIKCKIVESSLTNNHKNVHNSANHYIIPADICDDTTSHHNSIPADICDDTTSRRNSIPAGISDPSRDDRTFFSQSSLESFQSFPDKYPPSLPDLLYYSTFNYSPSLCSENSPPYSFKWSHFSSSNFLSSQAPSVSTSSTHQNCVHIPSDITQKSDSLFFDDYTNSEIVSINSSKNFPSTSLVTKNSIGDHKLVKLLLKPLQKTMRD